MNKSLSFKAEVEAKHLVTNCNYTYIVVVDASQ